MDGDTSVIWQVPVLRHVEIIPAEGGDPVVPGPGPGPAAASDDGAAAASSAWAWLVLLWTASEYVGKRSSPSEADCTTSFMIQHDTEKGGEKEKEEEKQQRGKREEEEKGEGTY